MEESSLEQQIRDGYCRYFKTDRYPGPEEALICIFQELEALNWLKDPANAPSPLEDSGIFQDLDKIRKAIDEMEASYELRHRADMRAIQMWQEATGRDDMWPDHGDLCVWLMNKLDQK